MSADEYPRGYNGVYIWGWSSNDRFQYPTATEGLRSYYYLPARKASLERMNRAFPGSPPPPYDERDEYHRKILLAATKILKSGKARRQSFALDENEDKGWYTIKCVCRKTNDGGNMVYCMNCDTWQHMKCYYPDPANGARKVALGHSCADCKPQPTESEKWELVNAPTSNAGEAEI